MNGASKNTERQIRPGADWTVVDVGYGDVRYETSDGIAKITICRPEVRNAFRPQTLFELREAFTLAQDDPTVGVEDPRQDLRPAEVHADDPVAAPHRR